MQKKTLIPKNQNSELILNKANKLLSATYNILNHSSFLIPDKNSFKFSISLGHTSKISTVKVTKDGKYILSGDASGVVKIWSTSTNKLLKTFEGDHSYIYELAISPNYKYIASTSSYSYSTDYTYIRDIKSGKIIKKIHHNPLSFLSFSVDNKYIMTATSGAVGLTSIEDDSETNNYFYSGSQETIISMDSDGQNIITLHKNNGIKLINISTEKSVIFNEKYLLNFSENTSGIKTSKVGALVALTHTGFKNRYFTILNFQTKKDLKVPEKNVRNIETGIITTNEQYIIYAYKHYGAAEVEYTIKQVDLETGALVKTFSLKNECSNILFVSSDDKYIIFLREESSSKLALGERIKSLYKLNLENSVITDLFSLNSYSENLPSFDFISISDLSFINNKYFIACGKSPVYLMEVETGKIIKTFEDKWSNINSITITNNKKYLITGANYNNGYDYEPTREHEEFCSTLKIWNIDENLIHASLPTDRDVQMVLASPDNKFIISYYYDKSIELWDMQTEELSYTIESTEEITALTMSHNGKYLVYGNLKGEVSLWSFDSKKVVKTFQTYDSKILSIEIIQDNKVIIVANSYDDNDSEYGEYIEFDDNHNLTFLNIENNNNINIACEEDMHISKLKITPDNKNVVMVGIHSFILWNIKSKKIIKTFKDYTGYADCISISPDSNYIISSSHNQSMILWDLNTGDKLIQYQVSTNNEYIATTSNGLYSCSEEAQKYITFLDDSFDIPKVIDENNSIYVERKREKLINLGDI